MARNPQKGSPRRSSKQDRAVTPASGVSWLHQSVAWPIYEVLLSEGWEREGALVTVVVARQSPRSGKIAAASFLVDLACLGIKSAFVRLAKSPEDYNRRIREGVMEHQPLQRADFDLVAKIIAEGEAYARELGFSPDPEYQQARLLLTGAHPEACDVQVPLGGPEGKPFFVAGPYDDAPRIMAQLMRTVGPEGFHYLLPADAMGMPAASLPELEQER